LVPLNKYVFRQKNHWLSRAALLTLHHKDKTVFCFTAQPSIQNGLVLDYSQFKTKHE